MTGGGAVKFELHDSIAFTSPSECRFSEENKACTVTTCQFRLRLVSLETQDFLKTSKVGASATRKLLKQDAVNAVVHFQCDATGKAGPVCII